MNRFRADVLFVHPEGNFWNNPQLSAIIEILLERGKSVAVVAQKQPFLQAPFSAKMEVVLLPRWVVQFLLRQHVERWGWLLFRTSRSARSLARRAEQIVAIDAGGVVLTSRIFHNDKRLGFISYELFFEAEVGASRKREERKALQRFAWFAAADVLRADELAVENRLPREKVITAPVAHRTQNIERALEARARTRSHVRRALHMGSTGTWTRLGEVAESVSLWPEDWRLVVHDRYGRIPEHLRTLAPHRVELSDAIYEKNADLIDLVSGADVGLALYAEIRGPYAGRNIRNVGLSSGKASTYLRFGTSVLTTDSGPLGQLIEREGVGWILSSPTEIADILQQWSWTPDDARKAITLYNKYFATGRAGCQLVNYLVCTAEGT